MPVIYSNVKDEYKELLDTIEIKDSWKVRIEATAKKIYSNRERYKAIAKNIPWQFIGVIHSLESGCDFNTHLHNGDSLNARTRNEPVGRPINGEPPFTWEESALDALNQKGLYQVTDWSMPHQCFLLEKYNGLGYRLQNTGINSPYLWSGSNHYSVGKFTSDHNLDRNYTSKQIGCIPLLLALKELEGVTVKDITPYSRKLGIFERIRVFLGTTVVGWFTLDNLPAAQQFFATAKEFTWNYGTYILAGTALAVWIISKYMEFLHLQDFKSGTYTPSGMEKEDAPESDQ